MTFQQFKLAQIDLTTFQLTNLSTNQPINLSTNQPINPSTHQLKINQPYEIVD
jgi:hypothetical protein